jgi:hypothetical protein
MSTFSTTNKKIAKTALNPNLSTEMEPMTKSEPNQTNSKKNWALALGSAKKKRSKYHFFFIVINYIITNILLHNVVSFFFKIRTTKTKQKGETKQEGETKTRRRNKGKQEAEN